MWEETKRQIDALQPQLEASADILKDYFRSTKRQDYKGRIGYARTVSLRLDTKAVKAELADRLDEFQVRSERETLSLLK